MANEGMEFEKVLQECLDAMRDGQTTVDSLLSRYPQVADQLRPHLEAALWLYQRKDLFDVRPGYLNASRSRVVGQIRQEMVAQNTLQPSKPLAILEKFWRSFFGQARVTQGLAAVILVACLLAFSGGSLAWASRTALPGDQLYSMKISLEATRLALASSDYRDAILYLEFAENRVEEIHALANSGKYSLIAATVDEYILQIGKGLQSLEDVSAKDAPRARLLVARYAQHLTSQQILLSAAAIISDSSAMADLQRALRTTEWSLLTVQEILVDLENGTTDRPVSSSTVTPTPTATATTAASPLPEMLPSALSPTLSATPRATPTGTPASILEDELDDKKPHPTRKPTKTPKVLPNPTRRPPKPTSKP